MNIRSATEQIEGAVRAYLAKDEHGLYLVPPQMQRPIIVMGPPGVGKTAVVAQVADRLGVNFVSYSITHHTRQSALGLPYIAEAEFGGRTYRVSRYTMSEIVAAAYDSIEATGVNEGILFLDEVNCASETLMPAMLQFLQYKTFGQHRLPEGWAIVCAGNPPEYNRAAREFDPAMMDRLKRIDVEPDFEVWMDYAVTHGVHPAITTYLSSKPANFYKVRASVNGTRMVTARGWEDLSRMLLAYAHEGIETGQELVSQYLQDKQVSEDFSLYLRLFEKYQDDYKVADILSGSAGEDICGRAARAPFDERVALVNLLLDALVSQAHAVDARELALSDVRSELGLREGDAGTPAAQGGAGRLAALAAKAQDELAEARSKGGVPEGRLLRLAGRQELLEGLRALLARIESERRPETDAQRVAERLSSRLDEHARELEAEATSCARGLDHALDFLDGCFGEGQELLVFVTHLAVDPTFMGFVANHGSDSLARHGSALMLHERGSELLGRIEALGR
ncbi:MULTISPECIES: ATP-binding protein [Olsenella]|uniref:ATP-binding protein n=1 Tax=Olsenella TaxID=133925 RepID=UPI000231ED7E|nr:MoxR family ATPase [Olsenella sp. oral taxon 809]EHF01633.1 hypothetical protein HMPREF1008_01257 [Olsenella sp. oral taxon 809 str. F0356]